jgi:hypothetical protein
MIYKIERRRSVRPLVITVFLCFFNYAYSQSTEVERISYTHLNQNLKSHFDSVAIINPGNLHSSNIEKDKRLPFLDTLKKKASKNKITRKIFEAVVVTPDTSRKYLNGGSEEEYRMYSGRRIRNIEVRRLNVFGADINNDLLSPDPFQNVLNKTHINTLERIIRNNLIFSKGDTLWPLAVSENERILRDLSFIDDARIKVLPVSENEVDIHVITKDNYSLGGSYSPAGLKKGVAGIFDKNFLGIGHEIGLEMPYNGSMPDSPGFGIHYLMDNLLKSFINMNIFYYNGLGEETYGIDLIKRHISSKTKYAGGISIRHVGMNVDLDTMKTPAPLKYNLQDYWISRSYLLNNENVTRLIFAARYTNNNVYDRPYILPDSYHSFQRYRLFLGSVAISRQRYYKTNLVYGYGRTEDIPYGGLLKVTLGKEYNEFKTRQYAGSELSFSNLFPEFGYLYSAAGFGAFINNSRTEQGILSVRLKYFSNLVPLGRFMIRNFVKFDYTRGFDRNLDEKLHFINDNGFTGFKNDSVIGTQRITINLETVLFSPVNLYNFRFAFFGFADFSSLAGTNQILAHGTSLSGIGIGIRVRNDNLVFNTFQVRLGFFPDPPAYSKINYLILSGEQPLRSDNFESGPPTMIPFR